MKTQLMLTTAVGLMLGTAAIAQAPSSADQQNPSRPNAASTSPGATNSGNAAQSASEKDRTNANPSPRDSTGNAAANSTTSNAPPRSDSSAANPTTSDRSGAGSAAQNQQTRNTGAGRTGSAADSGPNDAGSRGSNSAQSETAAGANGRTQNNAPANAANDRAAQGGANASGAGQAGSSANRAPADSAARNGGAGTSSAAETAARVNLDERQRTRLSQTFARLDVRPLSNVNFSVAVGTVIPGDVRLQPLPADVVEVVPQYRGFDFVAVRDEIVIVDPASYKIVAVLPRGGASTAASTTTRRKVTFSDKDREAIRRHARSLPSSRVESRTTGSSGASARMRVGDRIPDSVTIESFPEEVYRDAPDVREYRYIRREDRTYVVEPEERRIIEEID